MHGVDKAALISASLSCPRKELRNDTGSDALSHEAVL